MDLILSFILYVGYGNQTWVAQLVLYLLSHPTSLHVIFKVSLIGTPHPTSLVFLESNDTLHVRPVAHHTLKCPTALNPCHAQ